MKIKLPRLSKCNSVNCKRIAIALDGKCVECTETQVSHRYSLTNVDGIDNPFGVELECYGPWSVRKISQCVTTDCSLDSYDDDDYDDYSSCSDSVIGHEVKLLCDANSMGMEAALTAMKISEVGGFVDQTCGMHVHMSTGVEFISTSMERMLNEHFRPLEAAIFQLFPRRGGHSYARSVRVYDMYSHMSWMSISSEYPTIECRLHHGTLDPEEIIPWIDVCKKFQTIIKNVIDEKETALTKKAKSGDLLGLFRKNSHAYDYLKTLQDKHCRVLV